MGFRYDFYTCLLDEVKQFSFDLPETGELPFLARQLAQNKNFSPASAATVLRKLDESYNTGTIKEAEYLAGLLNTALEKKIRIQETVFRQIVSCRDLFPYADKEEREKIHREIDEEKEYRFFYRRAKEILASLKEEKKVCSRKAAREIGKLSEMLMAEALVQEAKAYLYDAGFAVNRNKNSKPRKIDRSMQMIDSFFEREDAAYFLEGYDPKKNPANELDREKFDETERLFAAMDPDPRFDAVVVPVIIDPETGAGLYIYGMESDEDPIYLENEILSARAKSGRHHCFYTIFEYWGSPRDSDDSDYAPGRLIYRQYISNEGSRNESTGYIDLIDAFHDYKKVIRDRVNEMYTFNEYLPKNCPERFLKYFPQEEGKPSGLNQEKYEVYREEEKAAVRKQEEIRKDASSVYY